MPIIKSAKKRVKIAAKANARNTHTRRDLREALKSFNNAINSGKTEAIVKARNKATSAIDKAAKKNVIHKNKAARKKAQLAAAAKSKGVKMIVESVKAPKAAVKKAPAKAKTTSAKKTSTKK